MTYKILTKDTWKIIHRFIVQQALDDCNLRIDDHGQDFTTPVIKSKFENAMENREQLLTIPLLNPDNVIFQEKKKTNDFAPDTVEDDHEDDIPLLDGEHSLDEQFVKLDPDHAIGRYILIPRCKDGQRFCAKILE